MHHSSLIAGAFCGDNIIQRDRGEQCDVGVDNGALGKNCSISCQIIELVSCGNRVIEGTEECDDGNRRDFDGCSAQCKLEVGTCGDGKIQSAYGEECDDGKANGTKTSSCDAQCQKVVIREFCGDGQLQKSLGEECDLGAGNHESGDSKCTIRCRLPICGDRIIQNAEQCDDGNLFDFDGCDHTCRREQGKDAADSIPSSIGISPPSGGTPITGELLPEVSFTEDEGIGKTIGGDIYTTFDQPSVRRVPTPARTATGPGMIIFLVSGAAAGAGVVRRKFVK